MAKEEEETTTTSREFTFDDSVVAMIRELLQFSMITGTNFVDQARGLRLVEYEDTGKLIPSPEYVQQYNNMIQELNSKIEEQVAAMQKTIQE